MNANWKTLMGTVSALVLAACASATPDPLSLERELEQRRYALGEPVERIRDYRLNGWNSVDNTHLIIHTGPSDAYLLTLRSPCHNLRTAENIALSTTAGSLTRLDKVVVRSAPDGYTEHCVIVEMNELERLSPPPTA